MAMGYVICSGILKGDLFDAQDDLGEYF